jgi:hypothetical protein
MTPAQGRNIGPSAPEAAANFGESAIARSHPDRIARPAQENGGISNFMGTSPPEAEFC